MKILSFAVHGHFYQPPRDDPFSRTIPYEPGASPYANWNERILAECYRPNAELGNLEKISFNFGPTLTSWMTKYDPVTLQKIVEQDRANVKRNGVGNAIAQPYNHTILPLANLKDKVTQIHWGIEDFKTLYGRTPQGMWLPEAAVDTETLMVMSDLGLEFTILAPWQAKTENIDPTEPYWVELPGNRKLIVFFYHGGLSGRVSFEQQITINADHFAKDELIPLYNQAKIERGDPQLILLATDGELYGHHQPYRDRFLQHLTNGASSSRGIEITYPALWLRDNLPTKTIQIKSNSSWSCHHGINRWSTGCKCTSGDSSWKFHLRYALNRVAASIDEIYFDFMRKVTPDPWGLRNQYIQVILGKISANELIKEYSAIPLNALHLYKIRTLLAAQFERQRMFTSCGWFFDEFNRIEPKNNIAYAAMAIWNTQEATGIDLSNQSKDWFANVRSINEHLSASHFFAKSIERAANNFLPMNNSIK